MIDEKQLSSTNITTIIGSNLSATSATDVGWGQAQSRPSAQMRQ
jgi:hypothetical protein